MKIGRNDPCPCGSGKKYKKCCMGKDRQFGSRPMSANVSASSPPHVSSLESERYNRLVAKLMRFAESPDLEGDYYDAAREFFQRGTYDEWEKEYGQQIFHAWLLYFRDAISGASFSDRYEEKHKRSLSSEERTVLESMRSERFRLVEVLEVRVNQGLTLKDVHSGETFDVRERAATHSLTKWDLLLTRLRRFKDHNELDMAIPVDRRVRDAVLQSIDWLRQDASATDSDEQLHEIMTEDLHEVFDIVIEGNRRAMKPPVIRTTDGEDIVFCSARYRMEDKQAVRKILTTHRSFDPHDDGSGFDWLSGFRRNATHGNPGRLVLGVVRFEKDRLILETQSRERLKKGKTLIEKNVGKHLRHLADTVQDLKQAMAEASSRPKRSDADAIPPEIERQLIEQYQNQYYLEQWPKMSIPALDGMTPLAAAKNKAMRPRLIELLKDLESDIQRNPQMAFDIGKLWKKLKLKPD